MCELGLSKAVVQPILASSRPGGNVWVQLGKGSGVVMSPHDPGRKAETGGGWTIHHSSSTCSSLLKVISVTLREQHLCKSCLQLNEHNILLCLRQKQLDEYRLLH